MTLSRQALCAVYALIGITALITTWANVLGAVQQHGFWEGTVHFWQDTLVNESSRFITVDLLFLGLTVMVLMVLEARRLGMRGVWMYVVLGLLIAISLTVPLFMLHRERTLAARDPGSPGGTLAVGDVVGLLAVGAITTTYAVVSLAH